MSRIEVGTDTNNHISEPRNLAVDCLTEDDSTFETEAAELLTPMEQEAFKRKIRDLVRVALARAQ